MVLALVVVVACLHAVAGLLVAAAQPQWPMVVGFAGRNSRASRATEQRA
jgi:hypothetical protein